MGSVTADRRLVLVLHSEPILAIGASCILSNPPGYDVQVWDGTTRPTEFAVVVCDESLLGTALSHAPGAAIVVLARTAREYEIQSALERGVLGFVTNACGTHELRDAVRSAFGQRRFLCRSAAQEIANGFISEALTLRERDVLVLLARGSCNKAIATRLDIAIGTVKAHVRAIMSKLQATSRTEAASIAAARGLVRDDAREDDARSGRYAASASSGTSVLPYWAGASYAAADAWRGETWPLHLPSP